jgi:hypothetical protein
MLKRISTIIAAGGAAATLAVALGAAPSSATTVATWTVKPGGAVSGSGTAQVKDAQTGTVAKCSSITLSGTAKSGSGLAGNKLVKITSGSFTGCTIGTISVSVTVNGLPWYLNAKSYVSSTGVTSGTITGIDLVATAPGCTATLDGTAAGADNGTVKGTYTNSSGVLKLLPTGGNLHAWGVSGCLGLINNGDTAKPSGSATVTPKQTITSP